MTYKIFYWLEGKIYTSGALPHNISIKVEDDWFLNRSEITVIERVFNKFFKIVQKHELPIIANVELILEKKNTDETKREETRDSI
jgi:hypothetical protein